MTSPQVRREMSDKDALSVGSDTESITAGSFSDDIIAKGFAPDMAACDHIFKIIVVGPSGVGKSCLIYTFTAGEFLSQHDLTVGVEFAIRLISLNGKRIKLQIWDTAGQESFKSLTRNYYRGAHGVLLVYDITRKDTFQYLQYWLTEVYTYCDPAVVSVMLLGNKCDLGERQVSVEDAQKFAEQNGIKYIEATAKSTMLVEEVFTALSKDVFSKVAETSSAPLVSTSSISLSDKNDHAPQKALQQKESTCCK